MKILALADKESRYYWDFYEPGRLDGIDLIISCGDLDANYLSFLATFTTAPVLYVPGNHDDKYEKQGPDGCVPIDGKIYVHEGVRILGLGGSLRYKPGIYQYEQKEMRRKVQKCRWQIRKHKGFDILVTHSPAYGIGDGEDRPHRGFAAFLPLLDKYQPKYYLHGHVHMSYGRQFGRHNAYGESLIINPYETYIFEYETEYEKEIAKAKANAKRREIPEEVRKADMKSSRIE